MEHPGTRGARIQETRRRRRKGGASEGQYSLFAASPRLHGVDSGHFRRQAALCRRLSSALHQRELVEALSRLEDEFESEAERLEGTGAPDRAQ